jgi:hypothetical protein
MRQPHGVWRPCNLQVMSAASSLVQLVSEWLCAVPKKKLVAPQTLHGRAGTASTRPPNTPEPQCDTAEVLNENPRQRSSLESAILAAGNIHVGIYQLGTKCCNCQPCQPQLRESFNDWTIHLKIVQSTKSMQFNCPNNACLPCSLYTKWMHKTVPQPSTNTATHVILLHTSNHSNNLTYPSITQTPLAVCMAAIRL